VNSSWKRVVLAVAVLVTAVPTAGRAQGAGAPPGERLVDETVAVVGGTPLLRSDLEKRVQGVAEQLQVDLADTSVYNRLHREVIRGMIDDQLLLLEAEARNLKPSEEEITQEVDGAIDEHVRRLGGQAGFQAQLKKEGLTEDELRREYRTEARQRILAGMLVQQEIRPKINVTEEMGRRFFEENRAQLPAKPRALRLQDLFLRTRADSLVERRARDTALDVRGKIVAGLSFEDAAVQYSDDPRGKEGGTLGRFKKGELEPALEAAAFSQPVGELGPPVQTPYGFHIVKVIGRDPNGEWVELKHVLIGVVPTKSDEARTRARADDLRRRVLSGSLDFAAAVRQYSDDPDAKTGDGDLGWVPIERLPEEMKAVADTLRVGRISPPVAGEQGVHLFKVLGEQAEGTYTYEEVAEQMRQYAGQKLMEEKLRVWLDELRKKYPVDQKMKW
jgi:peptidyl-prolyl cis-trans isomerase SurA